MPFKNCAKCGKEYTWGEVKNVYSSTYCAECAKVVKREKNRERQKRFREQHKNKPTE